MTPTFTEEQLAIVYEDINSNLKVIAVAGSGKSTVLVYRIGHFLDSGISADEILVIMFNDSAAVNFREDLAVLDYFSLPEVKTYHSYANKMCYSLTKAGYMPRMHLEVSEYKYRQFYREILNQVVPKHLHGKINPNKHDVIADFIGFCELIKSVVEPAKKVFDEYNYPTEKLVYVEAFEQSEYIRKSRNIQFFSDLIYDVVMLTRDNVSAREHVQNKFRYVLVDEYQDSNNACHELLKVIAGDTAIVNVVGDDDQILYSHTGAHSKYLTRYIDNDFAQTKMFTLSYTFRYGHSISLMANNCIHNNLDRISKMCISGRKDLHTVISTAKYKAKQIDVEQTDLVNQIKQWVLDGGKFSDIVILIRNYTNTFAIECALLRYGLPYFISKQNSTVLHTKHAEFFFAVLTILGDKRGVKPPNLAMAFYIYLTNSIYGVTTADLKPTIIHLLRDDSKETLDEFGKLKSKLKLDIARAITKRIKAYFKTRSSVKRETEYLINRITKESGIYTQLAKANWRDPGDAKEKFDAVASIFKSFSEDINESLTMASQLKTSFSNIEEGADVIEITTLHKSKGLAWPFVIVANCEERILPSSLGEDTEAAIESERRLFYVGITRTKQKLCLHIPYCEQFDSYCSQFKSQMPKLDYLKDGHVSRFVYETNLIPSTILSMEILQNRDASQITATDNRHLFNQYLFKLDKPFRISGLINE